jgi:hypothetical protein
MATKVLIKTEFPTPEEVAAYHKIPPARVAELQQMMKEIRAEDETRLTRARKRTASKKK